MRRIKTCRIRLWVKRRLLSCFRCLGSCGTTFANCTGTVLYSPEGAVEFFGRVLHADATYMCGERYNVTTGLFCEAIEEAFGWRHDQRAVAARFAGRAGAPVLVAVRRESKAKQ